MMGSESESVSAETDKKSKSESETKPEKEKEKPKERIIKQPGNIHIKLLTRLYNFATITFCSNCRVAYSKRDKCFKLVDNHWILQVICWVFQTGLLIRGLLEIRDSYDAVLLEYHKLLPYANFFFRLTIWFTPFLSLHHNWIDRSGVSRYLKDLQIEGTDRIYVRDEYPSRRDYKLQFWLFVHMTITTVFAVGWVFSSFDADLLDIVKVYKTSGERVEKVFGIGVDSDTHFCYCMILPTIALIILELYYCIVMHMPHIAYVGFSMCSYRLTKTVRAFINTEEYNDLTTKDFETAFTLFDTYRNVQKRRDHLTWPFILSCVAVTLCFIAVTMLEVDPGARFHFTGKWAIIYYGIEFFGCNINNPELMLDTCFVFMNLKNAAEVFQKSQTSTKKSVKFFQGAN